MNHALAIALLLPFTGWSAAFLAIYGVQTVGCSAGWQNLEFYGVSHLRLLLVVMLAATTALVAFSGWRVVATVRRTGQNRTMIDVTRYTAIAATLSTAFVFIGVFWLQLC